MNLNVLHSIHKLLSPALNVLRTPKKVISKLFNHVLKIPYITDSEVYLCEFYHDSQNL